MALLDVSDIHTFYGNIEALKGISLEVDEGEIVTLIGSNGAGKSTTLRSISGLTPSREGRHIFPRMTVRENLDLGAYLRRDTNGVGEDLDRVYDLFPRLKEREKQKAGTMSG